MFARVRRWWRVRFYTNPIPAAAWRRFAEGPELPQHEPDSTRIDTAGLVIAMSHTPWDKIKPAWLVRNCK